MSKKIPIEKSELEKRLEAEAAAEAADQTEKQAEPAPAESDAQAASARETIEALTAERDQLKDQLLRMRAEFDNYRKRTARDVERIRRMAAEGLISELLPVADHLELAMQHAGDSSGGLAEGVGMVLKQFYDTLGRYGLEIIPALGLPFDPHVHEALMQREEPDKPAHTVVEEFQKGFTLGGQVLRPAKVIVSTGGPDAKAPEPKEDNIIDFAPFADQPEGESTPADSAEPPA